MPNRRGHIVEVLDHACRRAALADNRPVTELARTVGINPKNLREWRHGRFPLSVGMLELLAKALYVKVRVDAVAPGDEGWRDARQDL